jgi:hypothetical protein
LSQAAAAFAWLSCGPDPVTVDGRALRGLPARAVRLDELAALLAHPACRPITRDAVWAHLVRRSRSLGSTWTVACVGIALPELTATSSRLCPPRRRSQTRRQARPHDRPNDRTGGPHRDSRSADAAGEAAPGRRQGPDLWGRRGVDCYDADIESAVLTGFLTALATITLHRPRIAAQLLSAAQEAGTAAYREIASSPIPRGSMFRSAPPPQLSQHPDLVLARAVAAGAISRSEAALIGTSRLETVDLAAIAAARGQTTQIVAQVRRRAERRLTAYLRDHPVPASVPALGGQPASPSIVTLSDAHRGAASPRAGAPTHPTAVAARAETEPTRRRRRSRRRTRPGASRRDSRVSSTPTAPADHHTLDDTAARPPADSHPADTSHGSRARAGRTRPGSSRLARHRALAGNADSHRDELDGRARVSGSDDDRAAEQRS